MNLSPTAPNRRWLWLMAVLLVLHCTGLAAQEAWPPKPTGRLVNDYAGILSAGQVQALERRLEAFSDSTSNQILLVITPTLGGYAEQQAAQLIGQAWGVGQSQFDNGVVILIKSKASDSDWGAVAIATGYGVEGVLPDIYCKRIIDDRMLPPLAEGDYYRALCQALAVVEPAMLGQYNYSQYRADERRATLVVAIPMLLVFVVIVVLLVRDYRRHPDHWRGGNGGGGIYFGSFGGGPWHGSGGGGFGGSGFGGGGGGNFGGGGGGNFGGGGASGRF